LFVKINKLKTIMNKNRIIVETYTNYIKELELNNSKMKSISLSNKEINLLKKYCKKYNLTQFEIYKYIRISDILFYKGIYDINLSSGITLD
jgi:hypothetical protein